MSFADDRLAQLRTACSTTPLRVADRRRATWRSIHATRSAGSDTLTLCLGCVIPNILPFGLPAVDDGASGIGYPIVARADWLSRTAGPGARQGRSRARCTAGHRGRRG